MWRLILNDSYFSDAPDDDDEAMEAADKWFDSLPSDEWECVKRKFWKKVFDKNCCPWASFRRHSGSYEKTGL
ncbi:MAG: hypothetical protein LBL35_07290 [Clostridiales bacterium]|jgi:hypothetical protein|nr:hypothetical protein [Clostridiales bacterium]